ncbi:tRNA (adenosine(37)-N6)-threonylcarbamoyltransferase complex ATPase subunit type 1 TsaE [Candidatus Poribacteria bacterium]|nr:MAG: tRNA (adenosine(37)-N6)-threonylcarbamoyltransferase complex ATPase subunit type 1 TsaE [Candidatus Poribacteria bacterium]
MCCRCVMEKEYRTESPEETQNLGEEFGKTLKSGDVVALIGDLGTGKTCLTQGIARGIGIAADEVVSSPSYILINEYKGKIPIYHIDLYRLENIAEIADLGIGEYVESDGICIIEWAERMEEGLPETSIRIYITWEDENTRSIKIQHFIP